MVDVTTACAGQEPFRDLKTGIEFDVAIYATVTCDGSLMFLSQIKSAVSEVSEKYLAENPGSVSLYMAENEEFHNADMAYGKDQPVVTWLVCQLIRSASFGGDDRTKRTVELPFPAKALWPNGRAHWSKKAREFKKHKGWAMVAMKAERPEPVSGRVSLAVIVHPKTRHQIDADNAVAAFKAYGDGIAQALGVDDKLFDAPTVAFGEPVKGGLFKVMVSYDA